MKTEARHVYDAYSTHQPVLYEALLRTSGPVIEFGCGHGSTILLHRYCEEHGRKLYTLESDKEWLDVFTECATHHHEFIHVDDWDTILADGEITTRPYSIAFVDQSPFEARYSTILALKDTTKFIILHDCDYFPEHGIFGENLDTLNGIHHLGHRTYDDVFVYYKEFFPLEPWPYPRTGPPTLLASNFEKCDWDVNFERYRLAVALGEL